MNYKYFQVTRASINQSINQMESRLSKQNKNIQYSIKTSKKKSGLKNIISKSFKMWFKIRNRSTDSKMKLGKGSINIKNITNQKTFTGMTLSVM